MRKYDHSNTDNIVCPHCGYIDSDSWEYNDNDGVIECGECGKPFSYCREVSVTYSTYKEKYEICPHCNREEVLETVHRQPSYTTYDKVCNSCNNKLHMLELKETNKS